MAKTPSTAILDETMALVNACATSLDVPENAWPDRWQLSWWNGCVFLRAYRPVCRRSEWRMTREAVKAALAVLKAHRGPTRHVFCFYGPDVDIEEIGNRSVFLRNTHGDE